MPITYFLRIWLLVFVGLTINSLHAKESCDLPKNIRIGVASSLHAFVTTALEHCPHVSIQSDASGKWLIKHQLIAQESFPTILILAHPLPNIQTNVSTHLPQPSLLFSSKLMLWTSPQCLANDSCKGRTATIAFPNPKLTPVGLQAASWLHSSSQAALIQAPLKIIQTRTAASVIPLIEHAYVDYAVLPLILSNKTPIEAKNLTALPSSYQVEYWFYALSQAKSPDSDAHWQKAVFDLLLNHDLITSSGLSKE